MKDNANNLDFSIPATAVIRANVRGDHIISSISVRDRLIKSCIASKIKKIIIIDPSKSDKTAYVEYANELSAEVEYVDHTEQITNHPQESVIYLEDGYLIHPSLLGEFLNSGARQLKNPSGNKTIISRDGFILPSDPDDKNIFAADPFHMVEIQQDNIRQARSRLFKWLDKESDGYISKNLNRPVSTLFSRYFADFPIHPNYFTALTALLAILMTSILIIDKTTGILWGCVLFHVTSVIDGIDGEIARAKFLTSQRGAKIDTTIDMITNISFMTGMSYALWQINGNDYLILGVLIVILALVGVLSMTILLYFGPGGGRFDILADTIRLRYIHRPFLLKIFNFCNYCLKRDAFAFIFAVIAVMGLGRYIPEFLIFGLLVWNSAIILNARSILLAKQTI